MKFTTLYDIEIPVEFRIIRIETVCSYLSISKRVLIQGINNGNFPPPLMINGKAIGWSYFIISHWMNNANINP
ncbi:hypothetical protein A3Q33_12860 [Colwellia sp. PAMC 21821]|nr:hypothetical protein A3Q33_12860 [Colwellia sp. PAMC 21821]